VFASRSMWAERWGMRGVSWVRLVPPNFSTFWARHLGAENDA